MKPRLIKFSNSKFGIRKWSWFGFHYIYLDIVHTAFWWSKNHRYFKGCMGDEENVRAIYSNITITDYVVQ